MRLHFSILCMSLALAACSRDSKKDSTTKESPKVDEKSSSTDTLKATEIPPKATKVSPEAVEMAVPADSQMVERCQTAIARVSLDVMMADMPKPSQREQAVIDLARNLASESCIKEGLSVEQSTCFDSITDVKSLLAITECPAIAAKTPNWLRSYTPPKSEKEVAK